jgi:hypothetical protein
MPFPGLHLAQGMGYALTPTSDTAGGAAWDTVSDIWTPCP